MTNDQDFKPDWFSKPGDSLRALMLRQGVDPGAVADSLSGGLTTLRGLLDGSLSVDETHAKAIAETLGGTSSFWLRRQANYEFQLQRAVDQAAANEMSAWLQLPVPGNRPRGRMSDATQRAEIRRRLTFYNVGTIKAWEARYGKICSETLFRTSSAFESDKNSVLMWLRSGEIGADLVGTRVWNVGNLQDRLTAIRRLSKLRHPQLFLPKLKALCAEAGVAVVLKKAPEGCRASGASRMVAPDKAMMLLSFRGLSDDKFWFTVFHEIGHLILHGAKTFVDVDIGDDSDECEREANDFASQCIIPASRVTDFYEIGSNKDKVIRFSVSVGVSPGLTVGQMQHRNMLRPDQMNYLKRRWTWGDIAKVFD